MLHLPPKSGLLKIEELDFYKKNGYLIVNNVLSPNECSEANLSIRGHADNDFSAIMNPDRPEFLIAQSYTRTIEGNALSDRVKHIECCFQTSGLMRNILKNKKTVAILEELQGKEVVGLMTQMLFKEAGTSYASQAWTPHQDNSYPRNENGQYITTNFFFQGANKENGGLYVYPGSHESGLFKSDFRVSYREKKDENPGNMISEDILSCFKRIDIDCQVGDMLILHGNVIHGSYPNYSDKSRSLLSCSYITVNEEFIPGNNAKRKVIKLH